MEYTNLVGEISGGEFTITHCNPKLADIVLEDTIDKKAITVINLDLDKADGSDVAFYKAKTLRLPIKLTAWPAFEMPFKKVEAVIIPPSCKGDMELAFKGWTKLQKVEMAEKWTQIPKSVFESATSLTEVSWPAKVKVIEERAFWGCRKLAMDLIIPETVQRIKESAFTGCASLKSVTLPIGLKKNNQRLL